jgi:integrase
MQTKITTKRISTAKAKAVASGKPLYLWDTELKGFGVYLSPKETVSWLAQKWQGGRGGKLKRIAIGHYPSLSLKEARSLASPILNAADQGQDISTWRRKPITLGTPTIEEVVSRYIESNTTNNRYWNESKDRLQRKFIEPLGRKTPIINITKDDLKPLVHNGPGSQHLFTTLRAFFRWCLVQDLIKVDPLATMPKPKAFKPRDRVLSDEEIKVLWKATDGLAYPYKQFYRLLLLTGMRRDEVAKLSWSEIRGDTIFLPKERSKNGREQHVHLSPLALEEVSSIPRSKGGLLVFTPIKTGGSTPISGYSKNKRRLDRLMNELQTTPDWRVHDLRRTFASGLARLKVPPHIIEHCLNHTSGVNGGLTAVYQRYEYQNERREALEAWGGYVKELTRPASGDPDTQEILKLISSQLPTLQNTG